MNLAISKLQEISFKAYVINSQYMKSTVGDSGGVLDYMWPDKANETELENSKELLEEALSLSEVITEQMRTQQSRRADDLSLIEDGQTMNPTHSITRPTSNVSYPSIDPILNQSHDSIQLEGYQHNPKRLPFQLNRQRKLEHKNK